MQAKQQLHAPGALDVAEAGSRGLIGVGGAVGDGGAGGGRSAVGRVVGPRRGSRRRAVATGQDPVRAFRPGPLRPDRRQGVLGQIGRESEESNVRQ